MEETKNVWISDQAAEVLEYLKTTHYEESIAVKSGAICELQTMNLTLRRKRVALMWLYWMILQIIILERSSPGT